MKRSRYENRTALAIKSEMTPSTPRPRPPRQAIPRLIGSVRLRQYHDGNATAVEMVTMFLQDVERATRCDISGATMLSWATVDGALQEIEKQRHLKRYPDASGLEEYEWKP